MPDDVIISDSIAIPLAEIELTAVRSQGAGGQNVNKVASAVHLRFDIRKSAALPERLRKRLLELDDRRITADGVVVIKAQEYRNRERNRRAALERLRKLLQSVLAEPKLRKQTVPSQRSRQRRLEDKKRRSQLKQERGRIDRDT